MISDPVAELRAPQQVVTAGRLVGNITVARILQGGFAPADLALQRDEATRAENISALKRELADAAADDTKWKYVVFRLNGFEEPDIPRMVAILTAPQMLKARAAVKEHLAGWPMQASILSAIEAAYARKIVGAKGVNNRPLSSAIWAAYAEVDYSHGPDQVWDRIGGSIGKKYGPPQSNSCAARLSWALNKGGYPVFGWGEVNDSGIQYKGVKGDGKSYIVWVPTLGTFFSSAWGPPDSVLRSPEEVATFASALDPEQVAIFVGEGHSGLIRKEKVPYISGHLPALVWILK